MRVTNGLCTVWCPMVTWRRPRSGNPSAFPTRHLPFFGFRVATVLAAGFATRVPTRPRASRCARTSVYRSMLPSLGSATWTDATRKCTRCTKNAGISAHPFHDPFHAPGRLGTQSAHSWLYDADSGGCSRGRTTPGLIPRPRRTRQAPSTRSPAAAPGLPVEALPDAPSPIRRRRMSLRRRSMMLARVSAPVIMSPGTGQTTRCTTHQD